ncbi:MAG TPA: SLC13 family permease, partial [Wenzhouxiangella sp.]|nr:SLC13 family permease [Wenzhouxiangella sp.]
AIATGASPAVYALLIGLVTSNTFILPTHPANALIMGPAGYKVRDFVRMGVPMSIIFITVTIIGLNLLF